MRHTCINYYELAFIYDQLLIYYDDFYLQILLDNLMTEKPADDACIRLRINMQNG